MPYYRVAWLLPISQPPIRDAWLRTDRGRIVAFGHTRPGDFTESDETDLGDVAVLPGLVNAHTHLELSWMRGRIPETDDFSGWIRRIIELKKEFARHGDAVAASIEEAIREARACGTVLVGDITNTLATSRLLQEHHMAAVVFHELLGFRSEDAGDLMQQATEGLAREPASDLVRHTLAPHSPYSVSPALFGLIRAALQQDSFAKSSVHLGESAAEMEFLKNGAGPYRAGLEQMGKWDPSWVCPRSSPVEYLDRMGFLDDRVIAVHGVHFSAADLTRLAALGVTMVTCPRGNVRTGAGVPPIEDFFASGLRVAVGTDSLASVPDLNIFSELEEMRRLAPALPARMLLESATMNGARALGFESDFGTIDSGKRDALIAVQLDGYVPSVEEYLVSGITPSQISWIPAS
ncbi:MAG: amidohydrolase family protein [Vicinamibacterales bacterium]